MIRLPVLIDIWFYSMSSKTIKVTHHSSSCMCVTERWRSPNIPINSRQFWTRTPVSVIIIYLGGVIMVIWRNILKYRSVKSEDDAGTSQVVLPTGTCRMVEVILHSPKFGTSTRVLRILRNVRRKGALFSRLSTLLVLEWQNVEYAVRKWHFIIILKYRHHDETGCRACTSSLVLSGTQLTSLLADQLTPQMCGYYSVARSNADDSIHDAR